MGVKELRTAKKKSDGADGPDYGGKILPVKFRLTARFPPA
jgi:hypothetical protein